jgi:hypothetical protein
MGSLDFFQQLIEIFYLISWALGIIHLLLSGLANDFSSDKRYFQALSNVRDEFNTYCLVHMRINFLTFTTFYLASFLYSWVKISYSY